MQDLVKEECSQYKSQCKRGDAAIGPNIIYITAHSKRVVATPTTPLLPPPPTWIHTHLYCHMFTTYTHHHYTHTATMFTHICHYVQVGNKG